MKIEKKEKLIEWTRERKNIDLLKNRYIITLVIILIAQISLFFGIFEIERKIQIVFDIICLIIWLISYIRYHIRIRLFELEPNTIRKNNMILIFLSTKDVWDTFILILGILVVGLFGSKVNFIGSIIIAIIIIGITIIFSNKISEYFQKKLK